MTKSIKKQINKNKKIAVLDCNNFFVSCERLFRPDLLKKPVLVLSGNDGCVVARSKEVKDMGIPMGVPYFQIKDIIKDKEITTFSSNFALYRDISRRVFEVIRSNIGYIEQYSIDECFFTVNNDEKIIFDLKDKIEREVGIPVSIGVGSSKTQAKYVNSIAKKSKSGVEIWSMDKWNKQISKINLSELWGVGRSKVKIFNDHRLRTVKDFISLQGWQISNLFGVFGTRLQSELMGKMAFPVIHRRLIQKSLMSSRSFAQKVNDLNQLRDAVKYHVYECVKDLNSMQLATKTLRINISPSRYGEFFMKSSSSEVILLEPTNDLFTLTSEAMRLLDTLFEAGVPYKKAGVSMSQLVDITTKTDPLFSFGDNTGSTAELSKLLFSINNKNGRETLKLGSLRGKSKTVWLSKKDAVSPSYTTNWYDLKKVS